MGKKWMKRKHLLEKEKGTPRAGSVGQVFLEVCKPLATAQKLSWRYLCTYFFWSELTFSENSESLEI